MALAEVRASLQLHLQDTSLPPHKAAISNCQLQGKPGPVSKLIVSLFILP